MYHNFCILLNFYCTKLRPLKISSSALNLDSVQIIINGSSTFAKMQFSGLKKMDPHIYLKKMGHQLLIQFLFTLLFMKSENQLIQSLNFKEIVLNGLNYPTIYNLNEKLQIYQMITSQLMHMSSQRTYIYIYLFIFISTHLFSSSFPLLSWTEQFI